MPIRRYIWGGLALAAMPLLGFCGWLALLPPQAVGAPPPAVPQAETEAMLAALQPRTKARPLVAIVGINDATETTDYLLPASALRRADVADVVLLATDDGPVQLYPALRVQPDATIAAFDAAHPGGADYVIVPAMRRDDDPRVLRWLQGQSAKGAGSSASAQARRWSRPRACWRGGGRRRIGIIWIRCCGAVPPSAMSPTGAWLRMGRWSRRRGSRPRSR